MKTRLKTVKPPDSYPLDPSPEQLKRLATIAQFNAESVREACHRVGLKAGDKAIDVGCGPVGALPVLAKIVGPEGIVVGLDANADALESARSALAPDELANVVLIHADIHAIEPDLVCPPGPFDLAHCRLLLMHQKDPALTLKRIAALIRPGGFVVGRDNFEGPRCAPPLPALERSWALNNELRRRKGGSADVARRYSALCEEAGLKLVSQRGLFSVQRPEVGFEQQRILLLGGRRAMVEYGLATEEEIDALAQALEEAKTSGVCNFYGPLSIEMTAQVPDPAKAWD